MSTLNKKTIQDMLDKFRSYRQKQREAYERYFITVLKNTNYEDNVALPKPPHELSILNSQIELLELILKNSE